MHRATTARPPPRRKTTSVAAAAGGATSRPDDNGWGGGGGGQGAKMTTIPTMTMKKNTDHAIVMPAPPTPHHHHHHHRVSSSSSSAVGVGVGSVGVVGVGVLPTIRGWTHDGLEGTVSGFMSGSRIFPDGSPVTTSRLIVDPGVALSAGCIVQTKSGSRYVLGDEARKGGGGHHRHHPRGAPPSSSTAATPWSMSSPMRRRLWRLSRPIASHLRSIGGTVASRLSSLDPVSRRALRLAAASLYVLVAIAVFRATHHPSGRHRHGGGGGDDGGGDDGPPLIEISPDRDKCQIVYVIGVEGSIHHGVTPILRSLAGHQVDRETGLRYEVSYADRELRSAIFGFNRNARSIDNPTMVRHTMRQICPGSSATNDGGDGGGSAGPRRRRVILEDLSFPSGTVDDPRTYRIHRQRWWYGSAMEQIAMSETAMNHPTNLHAFYEAYSPYADIRFVVLHRPYLETVASHMDQDGTVEQHSNVLRGFMLLLRRFLDDHPRDPLAPPGDRRKTWTLVCVERLKSSFYGDVGGAAAAWDEGRRQIASHLAEFLGWDNNRGTEDECPDCFDGWVESGRNKVAELGEDNVHVLLDHMRKLGGIWPPEVEDPLPEQKCIL